MAQVTDSDVSGAERLEALCTADEVRVPSRFRPNTDLQTKGRDVTPLFG